MKTAEPLEAIAIAQNLFEKGDYAGAEPILRALLRGPISGAMNGRPVELMIRERLIQTLFRLNRFADSALEFQKTWPFVEGQTDPEFDAIYLRALVKTGSPPLPHGRRFRLYKLVELLGDTFGVEGNVAECGCFRGLSSYMLCSYLQLEGREFTGAGYHIFDSFEGLSEPGSEDAIPDHHPSVQSLRKMSNAGGFAAPRKWVEAGLRNFPGIVYCQGWIPASFASIPERSYRFVHLDVDLYEPTQGALVYFHPRLAKGGLIVSDDYNWPGARKAIDDFCRENGLDLKVTDEGQAVIPAHDPSR